MLLVTVQLAVSLYATSAVTAATYDAARLAAGRTDRGAAEAHARQVLGRFADRVEFDWTGSNDDVVVLRAHAANPSALVGAIDRTIRVRVERFR